MSFTDGKWRQVTEKDLKVRWSGSPAALRFRCKMCGHKFVLGDQWRFVWANVENSPTRTGNFMVCWKCGGEKDDFRLRLEMSRIEKEGFYRFWWLVDDDRNLANWTDE